MYRYAVYFAPERTSLLWQAGCTWLGRDPERETTLPPLSISGLGSDALQEITADARRYGFHATLKPPFRLADGVGQDALARATSDLAAHLGSFQAPPLILEDLDGFMALTLSAPSPEMQILADAAVIELDRFRAPPAAAELARRRRAGLSQQEEDRLGRWGYPYVLEGFRFHLTLTRRLTDAERAILRPELAHRFGGCIGRRFPVTEVCLYGEPEPGAAFRLLQRFPLGQPVRAAGSSRLTSDADRA